MTVKIETERLILSSIVMNDAERVNKLCNDKAATSGTVVSGFLVVQFGVREVFIGLAAVLFLLAIAAIFLIVRTKI